MRLLGRQLLMVVSDGVDQQEAEQLKQGFEGEQAMVLVTSPQQHASVETVCQGRRGRDLLIDLPFEAVEELQFDGLIIPDGLLSATGLGRDKRVLALIASFHDKGLPIFASGEAVQLLYESRVLSECVVVREGTPLASFIDQGVQVLLDALPAGQLYRPTM